MHFVVLAEHHAEICPTSNAKVRDLLVETEPQMSQIAESCGVRILAGPFGNREHLTVAIVEANRAEDLDQFIGRSRLDQWNAVRVLPSKPMQEVVQGVQHRDMLF